MVEAPWLGLLWVALLETLFISAEGVEEGRLEHTVSVCRGEALGRGECHPSRVVVSGLGCTGLPLVGGKRPARSRERAALRVSGLERARSGGKKERQAPGERGILGSEGRWHDADKDHDNKRLIPPRDEVVGWTDAACCRFEDFRSVTEALGLPRLKP